MEESSMIVFVLGTAESFCWEVNTAISKGHLGKCVFVFPPAYRGLSDKSRLIYRSVPDLAQSVGFANEEHEVESMKNAIILTGFGLRNDFLVIRGPNEIDSTGYAEALRLCALATDNRDLRFAITDTS